MPVCQTHISEGKTLTVIAFSMTYRQTAIVETYVLSTGSSGRYLGFLAMQPARGGRLQARTASQEVRYTFQSDVQ